LLWSLHDVCVQRACYKRFPDFPVTWVLVAMLAPFLTSREESPHTFRYLCTLTLSLSENNENIYACPASLPSCVTVHQILPLDAILFITRHKHTCIHTHTHTHIQTLTPTPTPTHIHTHIYTHTNTHRHTT
jgi:hypothetical protein